MSRLLMIAVLFGVTIGAPYVISRLSSSGNSTSPSFGSLTASPTVGSAFPASLATGPAAESSQATVNGPGSLIYQSPTPLEGARFHSINQVLRFDVSKEWVYQNWARKSTGPTDVGLFAVRVALVTGTHMSSLAGSLTYFFNTQGQVQHISFRGRTGDTTELIYYLSRTYQFQRIAAPVGEQLMQVKQGDRVQSELRTRPEPVLWSTSPHNSFAVELELARPGSRRFLPPRSPALEIPPVASSSVSTTPGDDASAQSGTANALQPYMDNFRYATPQEESQVLWRRWPN